MKKFFALFAVVMFAFAANAEVLFQETLQTRRESTYIVQVHLSSYDAWPYASQWFTGYNEGKDDAVEGNQFDNDYADVKSYGVTVRGKKLNGEDKNTVGLFFSANKPDSSNYVTFTAPAEFANQVLPEDAVLKFRICSSETNGGNLSTMIVKINDEELEVPATELGGKAETSEIIIELPQVAIQTITFAFNNVPAQKFIPDFSIETGAQGIENIVLTEKVQKVMVDGAVYVVRDGKLFNVLGAQVR